ncbi:MAG: hypothetical protein JSW70_00315 [Syntrophobacterales bacterium]|nr:MAG: hypothetical protein JSW70_00315 [Syntrophobacterales bacterium]
MKDIKGVIEFVCEGGIGATAKVYVELRTEFPGIGGTIITNEGVASAFREEFYPSPKSAHRLLLRHTIVKKLEDYFFRKGVYMYAHIPRPLGSVSKGGENPSEAYIYEWAFGNEGFPWEYVDDEGNRTPIKLHDWDSFITHFYRIGIDLQMDTSDPDDGRISKNIIHPYPKPIGDGLEISSLWKRIDFGYESMKIDFEKLSRFLHDKKEDVERVLRNERYEMIVLAMEYLTKKGEMEELDIGRLDSLVGEYRRSSLRHHVSRGSGIGDPGQVYIGERTESLI